MAYRVEKCVCRNVEMSKKIARQKNINQQFQSLTFVEKYEFCWKNTNFVEKIRILSKMSKNVEVKVRQNKANEYVAYRVEKCVLSKCRSAVKER